MTTPSFDLEGGHLDENAVAIEEDGAPAHGFVGLKWLSVSARPDGVPIS